MDKRWIPLIVIAIALLGTITYQLLTWPESPGEYDYDDAGASNIAGDTLEAKPVNVEDKKPGRSAGGPRCGIAEYFIDPGSSDVVEFNVKVPGYEGMDRLDIYQTTDQAKWSGVDVDISSFEMQKYSYPVWQIDASDVFDDLGQRPSMQAKRNRRGGTDSVIHYDEYGYGTVTFSFGGKLDSEKTGKLSEDEIRWRLGSDSFNYVTNDDRLESAELNLVQGDGEGYMANFQISVTTPFEDAVFQKPRLVTYKVGNMAELDMWVDRVDDADYYHVYGPDDTQECDE